MRTIQIDDAVYAWLQGKAVPYEEPTPNDTLRRLFGLGGQPGERPSPPPGATGRDDLKSGDLKPPAPIAHATPEPKSPADHPGRRKRLKTSLRLLTQAGLLQEGQTLYLHDYDGSRVPGQDFEATIAGDRIAWKMDGLTYSLSALAIELLRKRGHRGDSVRGPARWYTENEISLQELWDKFLKQQKR